MFIRSRRSYDRDGAQKASGPFLMIFSLSHITRKGEDLRELRACIRHVRMHQCGHFMMGRAKIGPLSVTVSGTYGGDGLPRNPDPHPGLWERLVPLPKELADKFWAGGGHNCAGSEGPDVHEWATQNEKQLRIRW